MFREPLTSIAMMVHRILVILLMSILMLAHNGAKFANRGIDTNKLNEFETTTFITSVDKLILKLYNNLQVH